MRDFLFGIIALLLLIVIAVFAVPPPKKEAESITYGPYQLTGVYPSPQKDGLWGIFQGSDGNHYQVFVRCVHERRVGDTILVLDLYWNKKNSYFGSCPDEK